MEVSRGEISSKNQRAIGEKIRYSERNPGQNGSGYMKTVAIRSAQPRPLKKIGLYLLYVTFFVRIL